MTIQDRMNDIMLQIEETKPEPVKYYIGDLCYVMTDEEWPEVCDLIDYEDTEEGFGSEMELEDGRKLFCFGTAYGDGQYSDNLGNPYGVDSGTIGAIKVDDIRDLEGLERTIKGGYGQIHEFPAELDEYDCFAENGVLTFLDVIIDTAGSWDEEEEEEEEEEEDEDA